MVNSRVFQIKVNVPVFYNKPSPLKNIQSLELTPGLYFYMSKNYRLPTTRDATVKYAGRLLKEILNLMNQTLKRLQKFWYTNVNKFFDRRANGVTIYHPNEKASHGYYNTTRQHTGQLRRSLKIGNVSPFKGELFVTRLYAKTNGADYSQILINGAKPGTRRYIPALDFRISKKYHRDVGTWHGITKMYWARWQEVFMNELKREEIRLNTRVESLLEQLEVLHKADLRALRRTSSQSSKYLASEEKTNNLLSKEYGKSFYNEVKKPLSPFTATSQSQGVNINEGSWTQTVMRGRRMT